MRMKLTREAQEQLLRDTYNAEKIKWDEWGNAYVDVLGPEEDEVMSLANKSEQDEIPETGENETSEIER